MLKKLCKKFGEFLSRETILYLVFGVVTTLVNLVVFQVCDSLLRLPWEISNIISWVLAVLVAFFTNKIFVFKSKDMVLKTLLWEFSTFSGARVFSLLVEYAALWLLIDLLFVKKFISKIIVNVIVIVINYVFSKLIIFKKRSL